MNKKIYLLIVLILGVNITFGQQISSEGKKSLQHIIYQFGQLCDLSPSGEAKQSNVRQPDRATATEFAELFRAYTIDTNRIEKDSLVITNFLDPKFRLLDCYMLKNVNDTILRNEVDSCLNEKKSLEFFPKVSINQFIDTVFKYYSQTKSDINENDIQIYYDDIMHVGRKKYQVIAEAPLKEFRGNIDVNYSPAIGIREYKYIFDVQKNDQIPLNLRFYVSYDVYNMKGKNGETNFKIDSVTLVRPVGGAVIVGSTKARGYIEPFLKYGLSFMNLNSEDARFDDLSTDNNFMIDAGVNASFFFNNRQFSKWDIGFTTGLGYKTFNTTYSLGRYIDSATISDDYTAEQLGGPYDLYTDAGNLEQKNKISVLEVPLQFTAYYNFNNKRNLGIYSRIGGLFNLVLSNDHEMNDGSITYTGHIEKQINGVYTDYYFDADIPEYGFSTYEADVDESNKILLQDYFISGRLNVGIFGANRTQSIGWHLGTFVDIGLTNLLEDGHVPATSLSRGKGYMDSFYGITDELFINNWGVEFGISIQLFKEKVIYRTSK